MQPQQCALWVSSDQIKTGSILSGKITTTVTERCYDYKFGRSLILCNHVECWVVMVDIIAVRHCLFSEMTTQECQAVGFETCWSLLDNLRIFNASLSLSSEVTIIKWSNMRGKLVDNYKENHKFRESLNLVSKE